jgi:methyl-accepting chemotaxis protein
MSLRRILLAITGLLSLLVLGFSGLNSYQALEKSLAARAFLDTDRASELLLTAAADLAVERGLSNAPLHSPDPLPSDRRASVAAAAASADLALKDGISKLRQIPQMAASASAIDQLEAAYRSYADYRRVVADSLGKPMAERKPDIVDGFAGTVTGVVDQVIRLRSVLETIVRAPSINLALLVQSRHLVAEMAEQAGRERAVFGGRIAQRKPFTYEDVRKLSEHRGHVELAWDNVHLLLLRPDLPSQLVSAIGTVEESYMKKLSEVRRAVLAAAGTGEYTISGRDWVDTSGAAIATILKLSDEIGRAVRDGAGTLAANSLWQAVSFALLMLGGFVIAAFSFWVVAQRAINPLTEMASAMRRLAKGDNTVQIVGTGRSDEIGAMAESVQVFKDTAIAMATLQQEQQLQNEEAEDAKKQAMIGMADSFEIGVRGVVDALAFAAAEMQRTAQTMSNSAGQTSQKSLAVDVAATQASANVQTVATAAEELSSSVAEIGRQVAHSAKMASGAATDMRRTDEKVRGLAAAAERIGDVVALINNIASQTNLLALNATIEAARAGDAGRGFAVVATEVKALASQTGKATEEVASQISAIQEETQQAVLAIRAISETIAEINQISTAVASAVEQQGAATQDIARNVQEAAAGTQQVSQNLGEVTVAANESGTAAAQILGSAGTLAKQADRLQREVTEFLQNVRAA